MTNEGGSGTIAIRGDKCVDVVQSPIEQRNTGKGNPSAMLHFDRPLNSRQQQINDALKDYNSKVIIRKRDVNHEVFGGE